MRHFCELEKNIIRQICKMSDIDENNGLNILFNIFSDYLSDHEVFILDHNFIYDEKSLNIYDITRIVKELGDITHFINELKDNKLVTIIDIDIDGVEWDYEITTHEEKDSLNGSMGICESTYQLLNNSRLQLVSISNELKELVNRDFKTYEDIQLEEAQKQTKIAFESLEEARKQTESANASLEEAQKQTKSAYASLEEAQKQSESAKFQTGLSIGAVLLSIGAIIASIIVPRVTPSTIDYSQFDSIQIKQNELINTLKELKTIQITNDSMIKELNLANQSINEISNTLKEVKELNSKRK